MVTQRFGKGRSSALLVGDLWRWSLERDDPADTDPAVFWRQLVRWLVADVPRRVDVEVKQGAAGEPTELRVRVNTPEFQPDDNASVELSIQPPASDPVELTTEPSPEISGTFVAQYWPQQPGGYHVSAKVVAGDGQTLPVAESGWVFAPQEQEFQQLDVAAELLTDLASSNGGQSVPPQDISEFVEQLKRSPVPVTEHWVAPLWHQAWVFSLALACLCGEWGLRRWKGLA